MHIGRRPKGVQRDTAGVRLCRVHGWINKQNRFNCIFILFSSLFDSFLSENKNSIFFIGAASLGSKKRI